MFFTILITIVSSRSNATTASPYYLSLHNRRGYPLRVINFFLFTHFSDFYFQLNFILQGFYSRAFRDFKDIQRFTSAFVFGRTMNDHDDALVKPYDLDHEITERYWNCFRSIRNPFDSLHTCSCVTAALAWLPALVFVGRLLLLLLRRAVVHLIDLSLGNSLPTDPFLNFNHPAFLPSVPALGRSHTWCPNNVCTQQIAINSNVPERNQFSQHNSNLLLVDWVSVGSGKVNLHFDRALDQGQGNQLGPLMVQQGTR